MDDTIKYYETHLYDARYLDISVYQNRSFASNSPGCCLNAEKTKLPWIGFNRYNFLL